MSQAASPDTTTPSRRNFLWLASAPVAAYAATQLTRSTPADAADALVIAKAGEAMRLEAERRRAYATYAAIDDAYVARLPPRPPALDTDSLQDACMEVVEAFEEISRENTFKVVQAIKRKRAVTLARLEAERAAWMREGQRLDDELGVSEAETASDDAMTRMEQGVEQLAELPASSLAAVVAKARVFATLTPRAIGEPMDDHQELLLLSIVRDLTALADDVR